MSSVGFKSGVPKKRRLPLSTSNVGCTNGSTRFSRYVPRTAFKEAGNGVLDWPKVFQAAAKAGVAHYFVEQDQTPGDPIESLKQSYGYLSKLTY